ncbi:MAG: L,D-transpeptidase [Aestuariivita sp.]|nr:L,D-transpeptidase [Aestuariivita sp.]MCY4203927.1 L,D-transpeptidase [Aestuariivita sp.]
MVKEVFRRRSIILGAAAVMAAPPMLHSETENVVTEESTVSTPRRTRNTSYFRKRDWQDHFGKIGKGCILCDIESRSLHYWGPDGTYRLYPSSVPMTDELTRRGRTQVVRKVVGPSWTPTENMRKRDPSLPTFMPPGPDNPLGSHAMYLSWPAYLIHGTHDTRKIGRQSSSGCIGLYNTHIADLFELTQLEAQVLLL